MKVRIVAAMGAAVAGLIATTAVALAGWCWGDPIIGISAPGTSEIDVSIDVAVPEEAVGNIDVVPIRIRVPSNVNARVKFQDDVLPEVVIIERTDREWRAGDVRMQVTVEVVAPGRDFPVRWVATWTEPGGEVEVVKLDGRSNSELKQTLKVSVD